MTTDIVGKTIYRALLQCARRFDRFPASKVLIHRYGVKGAPPQELSAEKRLYAAGLEAFTGQRFAVADRLKWPLQRLIHDLGRRDFVNTHHRASGVADVEAQSSPFSSTAAEAGVARKSGYREHHEVDASVLEALAIFFPADQEGIEKKDMTTAGFAALRELSSKWALAQTLELDKGSPTTWRRTKYSVRTTTSGSTPGLRRKKRVLRRVQRARRPVAKEGSSEEAGPSASPSEEHETAESGESRAESTRRPVGSTTPTENDNAESGSAEEGTESVDERTKTQGTGPRTKAMLDLNIRPAQEPAQGIYLISHPLLGFAAPNSIFHRSVVLLVDHSEALSYGLVVNKGRDKTLRDVCAPSALPLVAEEFTCFADNPVRVGGPVATGFSWLHRHEEVGGVAFRDSKDEPVFFCGQVEKMSELVNEGAATPQDFSLFTGASTWNAGKLQQELAAGDWIMATGPVELAMESRNNLWADMLRSMGGEYAEMSRLPPVQKWLELGAENRPSDSPL